MPQAYQASTTFLERLISGLKKKEKAGDWDKSFGTKEASVEYVAADADHAFELPDRTKELKERGGAQRDGEFPGIPPSSAESHLAESSGGTR